MYISYFVFIEDSFQPIYIFQYSLQFNYIFLFLVSKYLFNIHFYRHQYFSIILITLILLANYIFKYYNLEIGKNFSSLFYRLVYSVFKALFIAYIKGLMEYKYISPYKVCFIFGIFNFIIVTVVYIIISFIPCDAGCCVVEYNEKEYFGNIILIFGLYGLYMFLLLFLKALLTLLSYIIIYEFSVCHSFIILNLSEIREFGLLRKKYEYIAYIIFRCITIYFLVNILILIFLEIIEINICGLSFNTKKNIESRAILDSKYSIDDEMYDDESSNQENNEEIKSQEELNKIN